MAVYALGRAAVFPDPREADDDGLVAVGGDLSPERLLAAYRAGIFPWFGDDPVLWFSPDPRMVLLPGKFRAGRTLRAALRKNQFEIRLDTAFPDVMKACAATPRRHEPGTWITPGMIRGYTALHRAGFAHAAEAWRDGELAGGLYGVSLGAAFFGESMFHRRPDASKVAFAWLVRQLAAWGMDFVDCQVSTEHLARFGAALVSREAYLRRLARALRRPTRKGPWAFDAAVLARRGEW
ncbi:MAG: leucyl/phenylalanyl-tRNA--protein transferase [Planctomycetota bacterium]